MKTSDFINEELNMVTNAAQAHRDHEVHMAREECYTCANNAIELHKLLGKVSEEHGLDGWASRKISIANDYLNTVREWLEYEIKSHRLGEDADAGGTSSVAIAAAPPQNLLSKKKIIKRKMP